MPRHARPKWDEERQCWAARVGAHNGQRSKLVRFPRHDEHGRPVGPRSERWAWSYLAKLQAGTLPARTAPRAAQGPRPGQVTVGQARELYLAALDQRRRADQISARHVQDARYRLAKLCTERPDPTLDPLGEWPLSAVDVPALEALERVLRARGLKAEYVRGLLRSLRGMIAWASRPAVDRPALVAVNRGLGFRMGPAPRSEPRYADRSMIAAWLRWLRHRAKAAPLSDRVYCRNFLLLQRFVLAVGARPGEACALKWEHVDLVAGTAMLPPDRWKSGRKTGRPRLIVLPPRVRRVLQSERASGAARSAWVFFHGPGKGGKGRDGPWLSSDSLGRRLRNERAAARRAGFRVDAGVTNYLWRHTAASNLAMRGVPVAVSAELLGTSVEMLSRVYVHVQRRALEEAARLTSAPRRKTE